MRDKFYSFIAALALVTVIILAFLFATMAIHQPGITSSRSTNLHGWETDTSKAIIPFDELTAGGPGKDDIPAIIAPKFESPSGVQHWLTDCEPVISVTVGSTTKAYPLQILLWHEIINDSIEDTPIAVTFCPLSYSVSVFKRDVRNRTLIFGVTGILRNSGMIMYDRQTETLWQQFTGRAIIGEMAGIDLEQIPSQLISFGQFRESANNSYVLSRDTGYTRPYGENPYIGYDDASGLPSLFRGRVRATLPPMEKVIAFEIEDRSVAYPCFITKAKGVINDEIHDLPIAVFHSGGSVSALDRRFIKNSRPTGSTAVFSRRLDSERLTFTYNGKYFTDLQTRSKWTITGKAIYGPLKGKQLTPINHKNCFAFAWLVFKPETQVYR